jgi:hypothetical protein
MSTEHRWNDTGRRKLKYSEGNSKPFCPPQISHELAWDWSWAFLVTVQRLITWNMARRRCEVLIRNGVRIRTRNLRNAIYYINTLNLKYSLFLQICAFCIIIYRHPFVLVIHTHLITSSGHNFMTRFSSFKLRGSRHSQIWFKSICDTGTSYVPTISSDWMF